MADPAAVLIIEDEEDLRDALAEFLGRRGYAVRRAPDANQARRLLAEAPADAVILHISLPGEDGLSLARALRAGGDIGILMLTGAGEVIDRVVGLEIGADDYLTKPVDLRELLARLRAVLRRRDSALHRLAAPDPRRVRFGRRLLDLESRRLTGPDGTEIALSALEFSLLRAFAEHPGRILSRERLLALAHPRGEEHFDPSIDIRIARIRRKLEVAPSTPAVIRTIRGEGYVFDPNADA